MDTQLLEMRHIHKRFPGVYALRGANLSLLAGEVMALVGENGAGKSTLIHILGGIYARDEGDIRIDGQTVEINTVHDARQAGISIIHQELVLVPHLSVAENIFLNREPIRNGLVDFGAMYAQARQFMDELGLEIRPDDPVAELTIAQQQMIEIVKAISFQARIIVMDEPTSSLSDRETKALFEQIRALKARGIGIVYISHKLSELYEICDRITVLRDGQTVAVKSVRDTDDEELVRLMVGREATGYYTRSFQPPGPAVLSVRHLSSDAVQDISFDLRAGEILGFAGLVGAGRTETVLALLGLHPRTSGSVELFGEPVSLKHPSEAYRRRIGFIPESRREESLFAFQSSRFNLTIRILPDFIRGFHVSRTKENGIVAAYVKKLGIKMASPETLIQNLSGGNQQKVILARWLSAQPGILIMDEPTRGIDVGAKAEIYKLMDDLVRQGMAILMISSELPEIMNMSDRVVVMRRGRISAILGRSDLSQEGVMRYAVNL